MLAWGDRVRLGGRRRLWLLRLWLSRGQVRLRCHGLLLRPARRLGACKREESPLFREGRKREKKVGSGDRGVVCCALPMQ